MMKWVVGTLVVTGCVCVVGCGGGDISSEGRILQVVTISRLEHTPPEAIEEVEDAIRAVPSKAPGIERFEWGRNDHPSSKQRPVSHCLLVLFKDPQSAYDEGYQEALREMEGKDEVGGPYFRTNFGGPCTFVVHDATPHVRTTTHGQLRLVVPVRLKPNTTLEEMHKFEDAVVALPKKISAIERLEWGTETNYNRAKPKPIDTAYRNGTYCLLFTFDDTRARDECLSHPAYKEFQSLPELHLFDREIFLEFEAHVE